MAVRCECGERFDGVALAACPRCGTPTNVAAVILQAVIDARGGTTQLR